MWFWSDQLNCPLKKIYQYSSMEYNEIYNRHIFYIHNFSDRIQTYSKCERPGKCVS